MHYFIFYVFFHATTGEKISPIEVDAVLLSHPDVGQAVCFGVPDDKYGEEVNLNKICPQNSYVCMMIDILLFALFEHFYLGKQIKDFTKHYISGCLYLP